MTYEDGHFTVCITMTFFPHISHKAANCPTHQARRCTENWWERLLWNSINLGSAVGLSPRRNRLGRGSKTPACAGVPGRQRAGNHPSPSSVNKFAWNAKRGAVQRTGGEKITDKKGPLTGAMVVIV